VSKSFWLRLLDYVAEGPVPYALTLSSSIFLVVFFQLAGLSRGGYPPFYGWLAVGVFAFLALSVVVYFDYWRYWLIWTPLQTRRASVLALELLAVLGILTTFTGFLLAALYLEGWVHLRGSVDTSDAFKAGDAACVWHFLDSVPALRIPETINWDLTHPFTDKLSGFILFGYKVLAVLPVIALATELIGRKRGTRTRPRRPASA
jgi:hypothetical protein